MKWKWSREGKWVVGGYLLAFLLTGGTSAISYQNAARLAESTTKVKRTQEVIGTLLGILGTLNEAESGRRGYILLGDRAELDRYQLAITKLDPAIARLQTLIQDHPAQQQRLADLKSLIEQRLVISKTSIETYQTGEAPTTQSRLGTASSRNRADIHQVVSTMQDEEGKTLEIWVEQSQSSIQARMLIELLGSVVSFGILLGVFGLLYRQTLKRQQAEKRELILAQEKELGELKLQFFSMTSHEFRTPLSIILGSAELLEDALRPIVEPPKLKNLYRIQVYAQLMTGLLADVLMLSRAEAGRLEFQPKLVEMQAFCLNLVEDIQVLGTARHPIRFVKQGQVTHAWIDEHLMYSVLSNLLSNAIKYSPEGKTVDFTLVCEPDSTTFHIRDEGIGMPLDLQEVLYQPFQRGENAKKILGTGLGLALVKKCLDLHHGQITVDSEVGVGTQFTVKIPQSQTELSDQR
ncbi:ATP-binding protein [Myxacorys almedinensis]|uniref:histidine kinase n=1 Tax=Myxacorys almedinensis A TaxID=2690445 RepID=A0A8J7YW91_9CYAN|nr:ATP-binding protein [Myxacorys almedinensis]NDJ15764.1 histidine kinase [Myxacorys almedinensis A]